MVYSVIVGISHDYKMYNQKSWLNKDLIYTESKLDLFFSFKPKTKNCENTEVKKYIYFLKSLILKFTPFKKNVGRHTNPQQNFSSKCWNYF